jgi:hypothetical protein
MWYFYGQYWSIMVDLELISINWLIQDSQMQEGSDPCANIGKVRVTFLGHLRPKPSLDVIGVFEIGWMGLFNTIQLLEATHELQVAILDS